MQVEELVAFAVVLGVPPAAILLPRDEAFVQLTREVKVSREEAGLWASGEKPLRASDDLLYWSRLLSSLRSQHRSRCARAAAAPSRAVR